MVKRGHFSVDKELIISYWGDEVTYLTGRDRREAVGQKYYKVFPRILWKEQDAVELVLKRKRGLTISRHSFICPFAQVQADIKISPIRAKAELEGARISFSDLTLCSFGKNLQSSQQFIDIGKTASALAHGVRNPLNAIKGAIVYLSEKYAKEAALLEFTKLINEEISRLDNFISRFLSTSISDGDFSLADLNALIKKIEVFTSFQADACNIRSVFSYGDIPPIVINSFQIEQAILNVINNALEAMRPGGRLSVKTGSELHAGIKHIVIEVSDTGPGMLKDIDALTPCMENRGRGFGLLITREILQYYCGHLKIDSRRSRGTTMKLYLPIKRRVK